MAKAEESTLEKVERELNNFVQKKSSAETSLKDELAKAKIEYDALVKEIESKFDVNTLNEEIKKHSYFLRLLKGEIAIPDDLNAKKGKAVKEVKNSKSNKTSKALEVPKSFEEAKTVNAKILFVLSEIGEGFNEDIAKGLAKYNNTSVEEATKNLAGRLSTLKASGDIKAVGKSGRKDKYSLA